MSADTATQRKLARATRHILKGAGAQLAGKTRGPDHDPEGHRRVPRRHSYDVDSVEAKAKWQRVGDGSVREGIVHREALIQTGKELRHQGWKETPNQAVRDARRAHEALSAELDAILAGQASAAPGRPAAIRNELAKACDIMDRGDRRLHHIDLIVLEAVLHYLEFATGRMFPSEDTIAERAGCHRNSVVNAKRRLQANGLLDWVRRTVKTGNDGEFGPQREQTSCAYEFAPIPRMASRTRERFLQILVAKLKRLGAAPAGIAAAATKAITRATEPISADVRAMRETVASLGSSIANAST